MFPALGYLAGAAMGGLTSLYGKKMKKGNPIGEADMFQRWLSTQTPAMANKFYSSMMGGPMGRQLRMNAMQGGNALMGQLRGGMAGNMNTGLSQLGLGLGGASYFNQLSQGQGQMADRAWNEASPLTMAAMQGGINRANLQDQRRYNMIGAGFGTMGTAFGDMARDPRKNLWQWGGG